MATVPKTTGFPYPQTTTSSGYVPPEEPVKKVKAPVKKPVKKTAAKAKPASKKKVVLETVPELPPHITDSSGTRVAEIKNTTVVKSAFVTITASEVVLVLNDKAFSLDAGTLGALRNELDAASVSVPR